MSEEVWVARPLDLDDINGGVPFKNGDGLTADAINRVVEAAAYARNKIYVHEFPYYSNATLGKLIIRFKSTSGAPVSIGDFLQSGEYGFNDTPIFEARINGKAILDFAKNGVTITTIYFFDPYSDAFKFLNINYGSDTRVSTVTEIHV